MCISGELRSHVLLQGEKLPTQQRPRCAKCPLLSVKPAKRVQMGQQAVPSTGFLFEIQGILQRLMAMALYRLFWLLAASGVPAVRGGLDRLATFAIGPPARWATTSNDKGKTKRKTKPAKRVEMGKQAVPSIGFQSEMQGILQGLMAMAL